MAERDSIIGMQAAALAQASCLYLFWPLRIACGKKATKLAMTWGDRISFVLTENLQLKRLTFLDILKEQADSQANNEAERFDIDFTLMTGEVVRLLDDLVRALGGEISEVMA